MKRKLVTLFLALGCLFGLGALTACGKNQNSSSTPQNSTESFSVLHVHEYSEWVKNPSADTHTKSCSCGDTITEICWGGTATCLEKATCSICNVEYGEVNTENHVTPNSYIYTILNKSGHSKIYACCNQVAVENETHTFVNNVCTLCSCTQTSEGLAYTLNADNQSYSVTGIGTCTDTEIVIPTTYNNLPVTSIGEDAFYCCDSLTKITIPDSVTSIGEDAFSDCNSLTEITIPNSVTSIGEDAFKYCSRLTNITVDENNPNYKSIDGNLYTKNGTSLIQYAFGKVAEEFTIPDSVTSIGDYAFNGCSNLKEITIGNSVTSIGKNAFSGCSSLTEITIGNSVTFISQYAFASCSSLTEITIPDSVTHIGGSAFAGCSSLTKITLPFVGNSKNGTENTHFGYIFGASKHYNNWRYVPYSLNTVVITGGSTIEEDAFYNCSSLTEITIGNSVTSIKYQAFENCDSLTEITIGNSVTFIGQYVFYCDSLKEITVDENNLNYKSIDGNLYTKDGTTLIQYAIGKTATKFTIPNSVTSIKYQAFYGCDSLTEITIPNSVTSIESSAFAGCSSLTEITIPDSVTSIESSAFNGCSSLTEITIGNSVTSIGKYAFEDCSSLTEIIIPDSVTYIRESAFNGCSSLTNITVDENNPNYKSVDGNLYTKDGTTLIQYAIGKTATKFTIPSSVTSIGGYAFKDCDSLTEITIPDSVTSIGDYAFYACSNLTEINIPDSVTSIELYAFSGCRSLTSVTFENTTGWTASETEISSTDLADTSTAATYLTNTYAFNYWTRSDE